MDVYMYALLFEVAVRSIIIHVSIFLYLSYNSMGLNRL